MGIKKINCLNNMYSGLASYILSEPNNVNIVDNLKVKTPINIQLQTSELYSTPLTSTKLIKSI